MIFSLEKPEEMKGDIREYVVLYKRTNSSDAVWSATMTTTTMATLTGLEHGYEYTAFILIRTTMAVYRGITTEKVGLTEQTGRS
jgi:hypothetical protein